MPEYEFERPEGQVILHFMPMAEAPSIGSTVLIDGEPCTRIVSQIQRPIVETTSFTSHQLARYHPDAPNLDAKGRPVFDSKTDVDEFCAKTQDSPGGGYNWDE